MDIFPIIITNLLRVNMYHMSWRLKFIASKTRKVCTMGAINTGG